MSDDEISRLRDEHQRFEAALRRIAYDPKVREEATDMDDTPSSIAAAALRRP